MLILFINGLSGKRISGLACCSSRLTNCNDSPGNRPFCLLLFWLFACKGIKKNKGKKVKRKKSKASSLFFYPFTFLPFYFHFTGIFSSVFFSNSQKGATVSISARSLVVWGDFIVGPNETTSRCGYLPRMTEHSSPA